MGRCTFLKYGLSNPFAYIEEWITTIPPNQSHETENHEFKLSLLLEGERIVSVPGYPDIRLSKGDAYSLSFPTSQTHRSPSPDRVTTIHTLKLVFRWPVSDTKTYPATTSSTKAGKQFEVALRHKLAGFQYFPRLLFGDNHAISRQILAEMEKQDKASGWIISGLCQTLTARLLSTAEEASTPARRSRDVIVQHALQYLQENCHERLTLDAIAWHIQVSGIYLAQLVKKETGRTVFTWLDHFRTEKARDLLIRTEWPLAQIAHACGYSSANLLYRHFKQNTGQTPMGYRSMIQKGEIFRQTNFKTTP